jgi:hypothetical protein
MVMLVSALPGQAAVGTECEVQTFEAGQWSRVTGSQVTFMCGAELGKASGAYQFEPFKPYALINNGSANHAVIAFDVTVPGVGTTFARQNLDDLFARRRQLEGLQVNGDHFVKWRISLKRKAKSR